MKDKILSLGKRFIGHELISGSIFVFSGFLFASFLNFILNLFLARNLTASDYGIYASLLSLFTLASIPTQSIMPIVVRFASDFFSKGQEQEAANFYFKIFKLIFFLSVIIFLIFAIFSGSIGSFLHLDNTWYVILTGLSVIASYFAIVNTAFLQSLLKFSLVSLFYVVNGSVRIIIAVALVYLGFRVFGGLIAILLATLVPFLLQFLPLKFLFRNRGNKEGGNFNKDIFNYAVPTSMATLALMSLTSSDVILVKHFFSSTDAGLYGGLSLIGKVIFYFTGPIPSVMFPLLIKRHNLGQNFYSLFYLALIIVLIPSIFITTFYFLEPKFIVNLFLGGGGYLKIMGLLGLFGLFLTLFSLINVFVNFFLSLKETRIFLLVLIGAVLQIIFIILFHNSFREVILDSLIVSTGLLISLLVFYLTQYKRLVKVKEELPITPNLS